MLGDIVPIHLTKPDAGRIDASVPDIVDAGFDATIQDAGVDASDADSSATDASTGDNGIQYHGGPVMQSPIRLALIWYGTWNDSQKNIIRTFVSDLNGSPWFGMNLGYYGSDGGAVTNLVAVQSELNDPNYSLGHDLTEGSIQQLSLNALSQDGGTFDQDAIYMVLGSSDVTQTIQGYGFCSSFCGWHNYQPNGPVAMKYAFIGNPSSCLYNCAWQDTVSPNGNVGVDAMLSVIAHELSETATDPEISAWYDDTTGMENADKCAWTFGKIITLENGAQINMTVNNHNYLVQQNWINANGGRCGME